MFSGYDQYYKGEGHAVSYPSGEMVRGNDYTTGNYWGIPQYQNPAVEFNVHVPPPSIAASNTYSNHMLPSTAANPYAAGYSHDQSFIHRQNAQYYNRIVGNEMKTLEETASPEFQQNAICSSMGTMPMTNDGSLEFQNAALFQHDIEIMKRLDEKYHRYMSLKENENVVQGPWNDEFPLPHYEITSGQDRCHDRHYENAVNQMRPTDRFENPTLARSGDHYEIPANLVRRTNRYESPVNLMRHMDLYESPDLARHMDSYEHPDSLPRGAERYENPSLPRCANIYENATFLTRHAENYEGAANMTRHAESYENSGVNMPKHGEKYENSHNLSRRVESYENPAILSRHDEGFDKSVNLPRRAHSYDKSVDFPRRAENYENSGILSRCAENYENSSTLPMRAESYENSTILPRNAENYDNTSNFTRLAESYENSSILPRCNENYDNSSNLSRRAESYENSSILPRCNENYDNSSNLSRRAESYENSSILPKSAESYENSAILPRRAEGFEKSAVLPIHVESFENSINLPISSDNYEKSSSLPIQTESYENFANLTRCKESYDNLANVPRHRNSDKTMVNAIGYEAGHFGKFDFQRNSSYQSNEMSLNMNDRKLSSRDEDKSLFKHMEQGIGSLILNDREEESRFTETFALNDLLKNNNFTKFPDKTFQSVIDLKIMPQACSSKIAEEPKKMTWANIASQPAKRPPMPLQPKLLPRMSNSATHSQKVNKNVNTGNSEIKNSGNAASSVRVKSKRGAPPLLQVKADTNQSAAYIDQHSKQVTKEASSQSASLVQQSRTLARLQRDNHYNPKEFNLKPKSVRFFIIKSYSEDDIHRSIKFSIWCSTEHGNKRLDGAYHSNELVYLFFSVNGSGHFCGMAQMSSAVDYGSTSAVWEQDKWKGQFKVQWIYVKDVPNSALRHIRLENNDNKPVTNSRDTQEVPLEKGLAVMKILHTYEHTTSIFDDFQHYEQRLEEEQQKVQ